MRLVKGVILVLKALMDQLAQLVYRVKREPLVKREKLVLAEQQVQLAKREIMEKLVKKEKLVQKVNKEKLV